MKKHDPDSPHKPSFESGFNWHFSPGIGRAAAMHTPRPVVLPTRQQTLSALARVVREARERRAAEVVKNLEEQHP